MQIAQILHSKLSFWQLRQGAEDRVHQPPVSLYHRYTKPPRVHEDMGKCWNAHGNAVHLTLQSSMYMKRSKSVSMLVKNSWTILQFPK